MGSLRGIGAKPAAMGDLAKVVVWEGSEVVVSICRAGETAPEPEGISPSLPLSESEDEGEAVPLPLGVGPSTVISCPAGSVRPNGSVVVVFGAVRCDSDCFSLVAIISEIFWIS